MNKFTYVKPTICVDEVKFCKEGKFFYVKYKDSGFFIMAKYSFDEVLFGLEKKGFERSLVQLQDPIKLLKEAKEKYERKQLNSID